MRKDGVSRYIALIIGSVTLTKGADIADGPTAFQHSSDAVFEWAPIADQIKSKDEEIIRNSVHLRWIGVRRDLKHTLVLDFPI